MSEAAVERKGVAFTRRQCGAKRRGGRGICRAGAMANGRCRMHGGATPAGAASPHYKHGRYCTSAASWNVPAHLRVRYEAALNNRDLTDLRPVIALHHLMIDELFEGFETRECRQAWKEAARLFKDLKRAIRRKDVGRFKVAAQAMGHLVEHGVDDRWHWKEILRAFKAHGKLCALETRRQRDRRELVAVDELYAFLSLLMGVVRREVKDRKAVAKIVRGVALVVNAEPVEAGDGAPRVGA